MYSKDIKSDVPIAADICNEALKCNCLFLLPQKQSCHKKKEPFPPGFTSYIHRMPLDPFLIQIPKKQNLLDHNARRKSASQDHLDPTQSNEKQKGELWMLRPVMLVKGANSKKSCCCHGKSDTPQGILHIFGSCKTATEKKMESEKMVK